MRSLYLLIDLSSVLVPFIFSFHPKLQFYKKWKQAFVSISVTAIIFISWDVWFVKKGVWSFNPDYVLGIYFLGLPIEEILFFICIPYSCLFSYHALKVIFPKLNSHNTEPIFSFLLSIALIVLAFYFYPKIYTTVTFLFLAGYLLLLKIICKPAWLDRFYFSFFIMLLPFFIVNGMLTGAGLDAAVVLYNDEENAGLRLLTIPVEDIFYGMLFQLMNVSLFEFFSKRQTSFYLS